MVSARFVAGVVVLTLVAIAVVLWVLPSSTDYSPANPRWNGLRVAAREFGLVGIPSLDALPSGPDRVLVILPSSPPTPAEAARLRTYLAGGGILVVMDDFGPGNAFLDALGGIGARFAGQPLADGLFHYKNMRLPRIIDISPSPITGGVGQLILNHATVIAPLGDLRAVAYSSAVSYLDASGNGRHDAGETEGPFPVVALGPVGGGTLVLVSDSSLLLNSMLSLGGNRRLITNIVGLDPRARILLDEVHLPKMPLDVAKAGLRAAREILSTPLATFILAAGALAIPVVSLLRPVRR